MIKVLRLASPEGFTTDRTMDRDKRPVTHETAGLGVVQGGYPQFPAVGIRQEQGSKITSRDAQQICR